jgi:hypothetical protein
VPGFLFRRLHLSVNPAHRHGRSHLQPADSVPPPHKKRPPASAVSSVDACHDRRRLGLPLVQHEPLKSATDSNRAPHLDLLRRT